MHVDPQLLLLAAAFLAGGAAALLAIRVPDLIFMARRLWRAVRRQPDGDSRK